MSARLLRGCCNSVHVRRGEPDDDDTELKSLQVSLFLLEFFGTSGARGYEWMHCMAFSRTIDDEEEGLPRLLLVHPAKLL